MTSHRYGEKSTIKQQRESHIFFSADSYSLVPVPSWDWRPGGYKRKAMLDRNGIHFSLKLNLDLVNNEYPSVSNRCWDSLGVI